MSALVPVVSALSRSLPALPCPHVQCQRLSLHAVCAPH